MAEGLRLVAVAVTPVMPGIAAKIQTLFGIEAAEKFEGNLVWSDVLVGKTFGEKAILFPRPDDGKAPKKA